MGGFMKHLIFIFSLLFSNLTFSANWSYVTASGDQNFYIDSNFYKYDFKNQTVDVWDKTVQKTSSHDGYYTVAKTLTRYSCQNKTLKLLAAVSYNENGTILNSISTPQKRTELIFPDSIGENLWEVSCLTKGKGFEFPNKSEPVSKMEIAKIRSQLKQEEDYDFENMVSDMMSD